MSGMCGIVLAGDRKGAKAIRHENKAFLEFRGEPLIVHVIRALQQATSISGIVVVGPSLRLRELIDSSALERKDDITVVEQRQNLLENGKAGYVHALGYAYTPAQFNSLRHSEHADTPAMFLSCDIPLVTSWEIDEMAELSEIEKYDYIIGLTKDSVLKAYYPRGGNPGIRMAYFHLKEGRCRHNNIHVAKPLKVHRMVYIEHMYLTRYQKKFTNMFSLLMSFLFVGRWTFRTIRVYIGLQFARSLYVRKGGGRLYERIRATNTLKAVTGCIGGIMDMKMTAAFTSYGGAVLDVDNAQDLEVASKMRDIWMDHQEVIYRDKGVR